ncbi:hypothetical protein MBOU_50620 [Mycobacterium bourgelatii]|uniref:Mannosyltransferase n=1 Tax=Mycobacterium bourgelatii TaxID=1273442 RepID=A0A7I9YWD4_MYCBU|nr:hypothetical protein MBOU_50620 [Mycobacterium bourgelatii]
MQQEQAVLPADGDRTLATTAPATQAPATEAETAPVGRNRRVLSSLSRADMRLALVIAIAWQVALTVIAEFLMPGHTSFLGHMQLWDSKAYLDVLHHQYEHDPLSPAFYPLFPLVVGAIWAATFHLVPVLLIGLVVNTVCLWLAIAALFVIATHFVPDEHRRLSAAFFLAAPAAFFMHLFYSEPLFVALGFWAYVFALRRRWLCVGLTLALLTATRLPAMLFVGLCGLEYLRSYEWKLRKAFNPKLGFFLLAPVGFFAYALFLRLVRGDWFAMFHAYHTTNSWAFHSFQPNFIRTISHAVLETVRAFLGDRPIDDNLVVNFAIPLMCIGLLLAGSLYLIIRYRSKGIPLGIFGIVAIVYFKMISSVVAVHRYTLPCLTIYIALAAIYANHPRLRAAVLGTGLVMVLVQGYLVWLCFGSGDFAG